MSDIRATTSERDLEPLDSGLCWQVREAFADYQPGGKLLPLKKSLNQHLMVTSRDCSPEMGHDFVLAPARRIFGGF